MDHLKILQSNGILKNANSYILTNREKKELIDAFNSLSNLSEHFVVRIANMPRDTFERLYKDKLLKKIKENRDSFTGDLIQLFIDSDPTENHKYIEWLAVGYLNNGIRRLEDLKSRALPALRDFILLSNKKVLNRGDSTQPWTDQYNINNFIGLSGSIKKGKQFLGLDSLIDSYQTQLNQIKGVKEQQLQVMKESELVFENELVKVYQPRSEEAACRLGAGTKWCTAARENNMFEEYSKKGDIKIIVPKHPKYTGEKYQFHHEENQYMNERDESVGPLELFKKYKIYDEIKKIVIIITSEDDEDLKKYPENPKRIDLSKQNWQQFPEWILKIENIVSIDLSKNQLISIPTSLNLPNLQILDLSYNQLTSIPTLMLLPNLKKLYISDNQLTSISNFNLPNLQHLNLSYNQLTSIPTLTLLPNLQKLDISNNQLTSIPNFNLPNLQKLYLDNNQLTSLLEINLPNLQVLNLYNNQLTSFQNINFPKLESLNLSDNQLTGLPDLNLPNLQELNLSNNKLTEFPNLNLPNLQLLSLDNNKLTKLPNLDFPNLTYLDLSHNQLTSIPNLNLPNLQSLDLNNNQLTSFPNLNLPNLRELWLSNNKLTEFPNLNLPNLQYLNLDNNPLSEIEKARLKSIYGDKIIFYEDDEIN